MSLKTLILSFFVLQIYRLCAQEIRSFRANHGEHCNKSVRCDTSSFLICTNSVCECQKAQSMYYDPVIKSCLVLVGEKCTFQLVKGKDALEGMPHDTSLLLEEQLDCVQNAWCNRSGVCMCAGDFVELSNGTCISKRNLGETCSSDRECRDDQFLTCISGECGCNETLSTYNILIRQCVGKAGKPCIGSSAGCVYNAECIDQSASFLGFTKRRMRQSVQICGCNPGFIADNSGFCRVGLGGQCSNSKLCADGFKCKDNQCVCPYENAQLALLRSQTCLSLVGGPCNETIIQNDANITPVANKNSTSFQQQTFPCVDNAYCALTNNGSLYECQCKDGFVVGNDGTCDLAYGSICNDSPFMSFDSGSEAIQGASWNQGLSCDRTTPLFCINGICQCESSLYEYNIEKGVCLGKFGARCLMGPLTKALGSNVTLNGCISDAECVSSRNVRVPYGKCACSAGYVVANNRTCIINP